MEQQPQLNDHNKQEYPPMHIVEMNTSLINQLEYRALNHILKNHNCALILRKSIYALFYALVLRNSLRKYKPIKEIRSVLPTPIRKLIFTNIQYTIKVNACKLRFHT